MIAETGVNGFVHLTGADAHALAASHRVSSIPHFAFIDGEGGSDTLVGWSPSEFAAKIDWLRS